MDQLSKLRRIQALMDKVDAHRMEMALSQPPEDIVETTLAVYQNQGIQVDRALVERSSKAPLPHRLPLPIDLEGAQSKLAMRVTFGGIFGTLLSSFITAMAAVNLPYAWILPAGGVLAGLGLCIVLTGLAMGVKAGVEAPDFEEFKAKAHVNLAALMRQASLDQIEEVLCHPALSGEVQSLARTELLARKRAVTNEVPQLTLGF